MHSTNTAVSPYMDDYDPEKDFQKILFKPAVSVQTRELNQIQSILYNQIERMGDAVFENGTIVDGCNFIFHESYPYLKIRDVDADGMSVIVGNYPGYFVRSATTGLEAVIVNATDGFEASPPDLKTLYVSYRNSGTTGKVHTFSPGETLTVFDADTSLASVRVVNGGLNFANTDQLVVTSAIAVNVSSGTFSNGEYVHQAGANLQITWIDDTSRALAGQVVLGLRPRPVDLANSSLSSAAWTIGTGSIKNVGNTTTGNVVELIGSGALGSIKTDGTGRVLSVALSNTGSGYDYAPGVSVRSANNLAGITALNLVGVNNRGSVIVDSDPASVGNGYAFSVGEGWCYHRGAMVRVAPQTVIVSKYSSRPDGVSLVIDAAESIVTASEDPSLLDPLAGKSYNAPGADRLRVEAVILVVDTDDVTPDSGYMSLVDFSDGQPTRISDRTRFSGIEDAMAERTRETDGDFVTDRFLVTTRSTSNAAAESEQVDVVVDPGTAYISGRRVATQRNQVITIDQATDTYVRPASVSLDYGAYVRVNELSGLFQFNSGDLIYLQGTAANFLTKYPSVSLALPAKNLGTARVRSMIWESGIPGTPAATYRLYLFDIRMISGKNFRDVRSVFYNGTKKGLADTVLKTVGTLSSPVCVLEDPLRKRLVFPVGVESLKNANNATYVYRTDWQSAAFSNTGALTRSLTSPSESFVVDGTLSDTEMREITVVPLEDARAATALPGTVSVSATSATVTGSGTTLTALEPGDYVYLTGNSTQTCTRRVVTITNATNMVLNQNVAFTNTGATATRAFPANVPIPFGNRSGMSGSVSANGSVLTLDLGVSLSGTGTINASMVYDVRRSGVVPGSKTASRDRYVRLCLANVSGNTYGPWCIGVPDAIRLRAVYRAGSNTVNASSTDVTNDFLLDPNHNPDFRDLGWLVKKPDSSLSLSSSDWLLVRFDYVTDSSTGFMCTPSYVSSNAAQARAVDALDVGSLGTSISTYEIPQVYASQAVSYDLSTCLDFRPSVQKTVNPTTVPSTSPINPSSFISFGNTADPSNDKMFPRPMTSVTFTLDQYVGRREAIVVTADGGIANLRGNKSGAKRTRKVPETPPDAMLLNVIEVPAYPSIPVVKTSRLAKLLDTNIVHEDTDRARTVRRTVMPLLTQDQIDENQPIRYSQRMIGSIDKRLKTLEQIQALSVLESSVKDLTIPSSFDPTVNRFKFGYVVDDFNNSRLLATDNPQHSMTIEDGRLVPLKTPWAVTHELESVPLPPYVDWPIVKQEYATREGSDL